VLFAVLFSLLMVSVNEGSHEHMIRTMAEFHTGYMQLQDVRFAEEPSVDNAFFADSVWIASLGQALSTSVKLIPRVETFMLASSNTQTRGVMVLGVDFQMEHELSGLKDSRVFGEFRTEGGFAVIGTGLANRLQVEVGDTLALIGQGRFGLSAAALYPISTILRHPMVEFDKQLVYLSLSDAQYLLSAEDHLTSMLVHPDRLQDLSNTRAEVEEYLKLAQLESGVTLRTWQEMMPDLNNALLFDKASQFVMAAILYIVIGFGLFGTILMMTLERQAEFGVLLSVGMARTQLAVVLLLETFFISFLGVMAGILTGFPILLYFFLNPVVLSGDMANVMLEMGYEPLLPFALNPQIFLSQALVVFAISVVVGMYPMKRIFSLDARQATWR
jgi:ABC-type lipoprotein release transport system permease subunit